MFKAYIGTKVIKAQLAKHPDGREGYEVIYPDGYASWSPKQTFEDAYRELTFHERQIIEMTDAEARVSAISDGARVQGCAHDFSPYIEDVDDRRCAHCGVYASKVRPSDGGS